MTSCAQNCQKKGEIWIADDLQSYLFLISQKGLGLLNSKSKTLKKSDSTLRIVENMCQSFMVQVKARTNMGQFYTTPPVGIVLG